MAYRQGHAKCTTSGNVPTNGTRSFHASVATPVTGDQGANGGHSDQTPFDRAAGLDRVVIFNTYENGGSTTTPNADTVTIAVYDSNGTLIKTLFSGAPPANGTSWPFYFTANGNNGGGDRCGQVEIRITAVRTSGTGGLNNYNVNSSTQATQGMLRGNMKVSDIVTTSGQDGAGPHYYGTAGNNTLTTTVTHTQPFVGNANNTVQRKTLTAADATHIDFGNVEATGTSTAWNDVVDSAYGSGSATYGTEMVIVGQGPLKTDDYWTNVVDDGVNVTKIDGRTIRRSAYFTVDPSIAIANVSLGQALYNRGESTTIDFNIRNAGGANLTRSVPLQLKDSLGSIKASPTDSGANYDINYTIGASDDASFDTVGKQWTFNTNLSDVASNPSANAYKVSRKMLLGSAAGLNDLVVTTNLELYNRGEIPQIDYYLSHADGRPLASRSVNSRVHDNGSPSNEEDLQVIATTAGGLVSYTYTIGSSDKAAFDAVGSPKHIEADWSGNTTDDSAEEWTVSDKLLIPGYVDPDNAGDFWTGKTDLDGDANGDPDGTDESSFSVGADVAYGKVRIQNIRGENYDDAAITMWLLRNAVVSQGPFTGAVSQTESGYLGWQDLFYQFDVKAPAGARVFRVEATKDGNTTGNATRGAYLTKTANYAPSYTGNLYVEVNYEMHDLVKDTLRFTVSPIIFATNNDRQHIEDVSPEATVDIDPQYHLTVPNATGAPTYVGPQTAMTRITGGNDNHFEGTISGLSAYKGKTVHVHMVLTVNGGQLQATFPIVVGKYANKKVKTRLNPHLGSIQS